MYYITDENGDRIPVQEGGIRKNVEIITANRTLLPNESGIVIGVGTDALEVALPATEKGLVYTLVNTGAAGNNLMALSPVAADGIAGTVTLASTVVVLDGTVDKDAINTKATSQTGDSITVLGTGVTGVGAWVVVASTGIYAQEA